MRDAKGTPGARPRAGRVPGHGPAGSDGETPCLSPGGGDGLSQSAARAVRGSFAPLVAGRRPPTSTGDDVRRLRSLAAVRSPVRPDRGRHRVRVRSESIPGGGPAAGVTPEGLHPIPFHQGGRGRSRTDRRGCRSIVTCPSVTRTFTASPPRTGPWPTRSGETRPSRMAKTRSSTLATIGQGCPTRRTDFPSLWTISTSCVGAGGFSGRPHPAASASAPHNKDRRRKAAAWSPSVPCPPSRLSRPASRPYLAPEEPDAAQRIPPTGRRHAGRRARRTWARTGNFTSCVRRWPQRTAPVHAADRGDSER